MTIRGLFGHRPKTAFVLGGGGNLGAVQVGQLRALIERDIIPDVVVGCSVGALNAAALAGNPTAGEIERLAGLWTRLRREDVFPTNGLGRSPWAFVRNGLAAYADQGLREVIANWLSYERFEQARLPLWIVATSLRTGQERWFNEGSMMTALMASAALPGFFPPVEVDGEPLIDGGVVNNVPISKALELRAKRIYVLDVGSLERERPAPRRPYEVLLSAVAIARAHRLRIDLDRIPDNVRLWRMPTIDVGKLRYHDFRRSAELIERAYDASAAYLDGTAAAASA